MYSIPVPIYMIFPRLFTCPTLTMDNFKVEFEINVVIVLQTNDLITENFPIRIVRYGQQPVGAAKKKSKPKALK